jgi:hypothetical protein
VIAQPLVPSDERRPANADWAIAGVGKEGRHVHSISTTARAWSIHAATKQRFLSGRPWGIAARVGVHYSRGTAYGTPSPPVVHCPR